MTRNMPFDHPGLPLTRRELFRRGGLGFASIGLAGLLSDQGLLGTASAASAGGAVDQPVPPNFPAKAKRVIWIFINGGPSHVDTWDYKPALAKWDGKPMSDFDPSFSNNTGFFANAVGGLMKSPFEFKQHGQSGKWVSSLFPNLSRHVDKMAFLHSGFTESNNHSPALFMMQSGLPRMGFPCVGAWATYGLGAESDSLPAFVVMSDPKGRGLPKGHSLNWSAGFLPSVYQGTWLKPTGKPVDNLERPAGMSDAQQRRQLDLIQKLQGGQAERLDFEPELAARIKSFELAYRMQSTAPEALDVGAEPQHIRDLYGVDKPECDHFSRQCLVARRLLERGTRFVQIYSGGMDNQRSWDGHNDIFGNHTEFAGETDQPVAALLEDLEQRGMLEDTLVIWGGEFGRLPIAQKSAKPGRDHNPHAFTCWMAGGGVKGGISHGATDEVGYRAVKDRMHVNDLHATILHLLGINHEKLTYRYNGRDFRLTDVAGNVIREILA